LPAAQLPPSPPLLLLLLLRLVRLHIDAVAVLIEQHLPSVSANRVQSRPVPTSCRDELGAALADQNTAGVTACPPNSLTPRRLLTLSRPLRTCLDLSCVINLSFDLFYFTTVNSCRWPLCVIAFAAFHLESTFFSPRIWSTTSPAPSLGECGAPTSPSRRHCEQHMVERISLTLLCCDPFNFQRVAGGDAVLFAACFNYSVHKL